MAAAPFTIPAGEADFTITTRFALDQDARIVSLNPVMRERGKSVTYRATFPDGSSKTILSIPAWNPGWQYTYWLAEPIAAPRGTLVEAAATMDNSEANLKNPDPWSDVTTGPTGEIFEGRVGYTVGSQK